MTWFLTPLMLRMLILYMTGTYSLKSILNDRFLKKLIMANLFNLTFCRKTAEGISLQKYVAKATSKVYMRKDE